MGGVGEVGEDMGKWNFDVSRSIHTEENPEKNLHCCREAKKGAVNPHPATPLRK